MSLFSKIKLKDILSEKPVSDQFGCDRGTPIDRYYIEKFLSSHRKDISGNVLEISESTYTVKFGSGKVSSSILHVEDNQQAGTIVGDLTKPSSLPAEQMDCFICTQTFNFIYDLKTAVEGARRVLKPEGVLLATVASMAPVSKYDADRWGDFWRFTPQSAERLFKEVFGAERVTVQPLGNSAAAALFMKGYAQEDMPSGFNLDHNDPLFPLVIGIRAVK